MIEMKDDGGSPCSEVLSLRDYFASAAMQSLILDKHFQEMSKESPACLYELWNEVAVESYDCADAMLRAREIK